MEELHVPQPRPLREAFIASTPLKAPLVVMTRYGADCERCGLGLLTPWSQSP
jgi:hypothetical protein